MKYIYWFFLLFLAGISSAQVENWELEYAPAVDYMKVSMASGEYHDVSVLTYLSGLGFGNTDDQKVDAFSISGSVISLSLEDDGEAAKQIDVSDRLVYYVDDAAAAAGGVPAEAEYKLDTGNNFGLPKGTPMVRQ